MQSNRTANFLEKSEIEKIKLTNHENFKKVATAPVKKIDIDFIFKFREKDNKQSSSFSFKNDLLDKNSYEFIKRKDECLTLIELDDSIHKRIAESELE